MFVDKHAATITSDDTPLMMIPHAIFDGVDGSRLRARIQPKSRPGKNTASFSMLGSVARCTTAKSTACRIHAGKDSSARTRLRGST